MQYNLKIILLSLCNTGKLYTVVLPVITGVTSLGFLVFMLVCPGTTKCGLCRADFVRPIKRPLELWLFFYNIFWGCKAIQHWHKTFKFKKLSWHPAFVPNFYSQETKNWEENTPFASQICYSQFFVVNMVTSFEQSYKTLSDCRHLLHT